MSDKYFLTIDDKPKDLEFKINGKVLNKTKSQYYYYNKIKVNTLNNINYEIIKMFLNSHKKEQKIFNLLYKMLNDLFCKNISRINYSKTNLSNVIDLYKNHQIEIKNVSTHRSYVDFIYNQVVTEEDIDIEIKSVSKEREALSLSAVKNKLSVLKSIFQLQVTDVTKLINELKLLNNKIVNDINISVKGGNLNYDLTCPKNTLKTIYVNFISELEKNLLLKKDKIKNIQYSSKVDYVKFGGFLNDADFKKKSYVYLIKTYTGDVGFLGLKLKQTKHTYKTNYSLTCVKDFTAALIFEEEDYRNCGINELKNTNYYLSVSAIECDQVLNLNNSSNLEPEFKAFAAKIEKKKLGNMFDKMDSVQDKKTLIKI